MKYWRMKLKGEHLADEIHSLVGQSGGNLVRLHYEEGETQVYFAAEKSVAPDAVKAIRDASLPEEVSFEEVTRLG